MKTIQSLFIIAVVAVIAVGCGTPAPTIVRVIQEAPPGAQAPWTEGQNTTYWLGRAVDSSGNTIREAHAVYRREGAGMPRLAVPPSAYYPTNLPLPSTNAAFEQFELLRAEVARSRDLTLQLTRASQSLALQAASMTNSVQGNRLIQEQLRELLHVTMALSNRIDRLEAQQGAATKKPSGVDPERCN